MQLKHHPRCVHKPVGIVIENAGQRYVLQEALSVNVGEFYAFSYKANGSEFFAVRKAEYHELEKCFYLNGFWQRPTRVYKVLRTEYATPENTLIATYTRMHTPMILPRRCKAA